MAVAAPLLEVACFSPDNAILAAHAGADRIELCDDPDAGGTTPPLAWLAQVRPQVSIAVFVMIRPRGGDFNYTDGEMQQMLADIDAFKPTADGFVFGVLDAGRKVDVVRTMTLVERAHPLPCTFHRAFDETEDPFQAFQDVVSTGCSAILSSGGASSAAFGTDVLGKLLEQSLGSLNIIVGGGVRTKNIARIRSLTQASAFHSSAVLKGSNQPDQDEIRMMKELINSRSIHGNDDDGESPDDEMLSTGQLCVPAVSIGTNTPNEDE